MKGERPDRAAEHKKKTMKTKQSKIQTEGLPSRPEQLGTAVNSNAVSASAPVQKPDNRLPIDREQRSENRSLSTTKVLNTLSSTLPDIYSLAEVVGKWVWIHFQETPTAEVRQQLSQLGFHWNTTRQAWQHPCGAFSLGSASDPHQKYGSYYPADMKAA